ncbi:hypothetical protein EDB81DRAFT_783826 [Dactylonectria macrodidyma]|uniref:LDB19 N-terminal domain-containing protein n=1 Tax=Dactylonectria macrodidyma TaxID=307937 RepID=A0A9P9JD65_9HYPO|nr:hypothetical protein EDB81DRAFT_783826 [Dactylonectria macrodidyma]
MSTLGRFLSKPFSGRERSSAVSLDWTIDNPSNAVPGSLVSGSVVLTVLQDSVEIDGFTAVLRSHTTQKQPFRKHCTSCKNQHVKMQDWSFIAESTTFPRGNHPFPFSALIGGHLPPSMDTSLYTVSYEFEAQINLKQKGKPKDPSNVIFQRELCIKPSLSGPNLPRNKSYLFASTGIQIAAQFEPVIRPQAVNQVSIKIGGLASIPSIGGSGEKAHIWRLSKAAWSFDENTKAVAEACEEHARGLGKAEEKSAVRRKVRSLCGKDLYECWTSQDEDGTVDMEFSYRVRQDGPLSRLKYTSDAKSPDGSRVLHSLMIELILVKDIFPEGRPDLAIRTGTARILSLPYRVLLADESGSTPTWDAEIPPSYQDVFIHPPTYKEDVQSTILDF